MHADPQVPNPQQAKAYFDAKMAFTTGPVEADSMRRRRSDIVIIDVRAAKDYAQGHIPRAVNLPKEQWDQQEVLDSNKLNLIYCYSQVCHLAARAAAQFAGEGFPVMEMEGGFKAWREHQLEVETGEGMPPKDRGPKFEMRGEQFVPTH